MYRGSQLASLLQLDCMCAGSLVTEVGLRHKQSGTISHSAFTVVSPADVLSVLAASPEGANAIAGTSTGLKTAVLVVSA